MQINIPLSFGLKLEEVRELVLLKLHSFGNGHFGGEAYNSEIQPGLGRGPFFVRRCITACLKGICDMADNGCIRGLARAGEKSDGRFAGNFRTAFAIAKTDPMIALAMLEAEIDSLFFAKPAYEMEVRLAILNAIFPRLIGKKQAEFEVFPREPPFSQYLLDYVRN